MKHVFKGISNWAKQISKKRVSASELAFSSRIRHFNPNWLTGAVEERTTIFGKDAVPFKETLTKHGARDGDIVTISAHHGSIPPHQRKSEEARKMPYEKGQIRLYTPEGELKARIKFDHAKEKVNMKKYSPAGSWMGKRVTL